MARITLEDLNGLDDEPLDEDEEPMDGEEQNRLFSHWEAVASTHQVSLPREMVGPIVQMTQHRQVREPVPYVTLLQHEKCEERLYPAGKWACITKGEPRYEQSISMGFMKLMRYICKENSVGECRRGAGEGLSQLQGALTAGLCPPPAGRYLGMTVPVVNEVRLNEEGTELLQAVTTSYYLPGEFQANPPLPTDPDIRIEERQPLRVLTRVFYGVTTEETILQEIRLLGALLDSPDTVLRERYLVAAYENPSVPQRRNEIWSVRRAE
ncbi:heme-binding protein 1-like isoform X1 [Carettochelys insculpta]|uniref:heme-binding protein 1-like isoform X1 n=1 Tax=Carettochelys insculpta TaxID=44489 RepID=UPI003EBEC671